MSECVCVHQSKAWGKLVGEPLAPVLKRHPIKGERPMLSEHALVCLGRNREEQTQDRPHGNSRVWQRSCMAKVESDVPRIRSCLGEESRKHRGLRARGRAVRGGFRLWVSRLLLHLRLHLLAPEGQKVDQVLSSVGALSAAPAVGTSAHYSRVWSWHLSV